MGAVVTALQIAFVFVLLAVFAWGMKRIGGRRAPAGLVSVPVRAPLTGRASLTVATVAGRAYVLGVTEQQVTVIDIRDAAELELPVTAADTADDGSSGGDPSSPPNTLGAALVYAAAHAKKAWAARRSVPATTDQATPEQAAAWNAAWSGATPTDSEQDASQAGDVTGEPKNAAPSALAPVPVKRSKSTKTAKAAKTAQQARARKTVTA